ncbi:LPP20 family lipoprotein [Treponema sp.]|uniref:LPP20 family lipoprotein n=1 Tax=Treponema sp. TaxID=166 RepID=UPI00298D9FBD|nr:LPP20 family lipoprotein [Treponema sp.]MCR5614243.1 LPP20 family lipoprotein [Treponema sp.]
MKKKSCGIFILFLSSMIFAMTPAKISGAAGSKNSKQKADLKKAPEWITNPNAKYNSKLYLVGVGYGADDNAAESDAKSDLIQVLRQQINTIERVNSYADNASDYSVVVSEINTSSEIKAISGLRIEEKYYTSDSKVYALAVLSRQDVFEYYAGLIKKNDKAISEYMQFANKSLGKMHSCIYAERAVKLGLENEYYASIIEVLNPPFEEDVEVSYGSFVKLSAEADKIKKSVIIKIQVEGDNKNIVKNSFEKCFSKFGVLSGESENCQYVVNAKINLEKLESPDEKHFYYNYVLTVELKDLKTKNVVDSYSTYGRAGHLNEQGAKNKAYNSICAEIEKKYYEHIYENMEVKK